MIVGSCFEGDGKFGAFVMWKQHTAYSAALVSIVNICQEYAGLAYSIVGGHYYRWNLFEEIEHRTLKHAHDIIAAAWRFRYELEARQMKLPGCSPCRWTDCQWRIDRGMQSMYECPMSNCDWLTFQEEPDVVGPWITWLENEVHSWKRCPWLIRSIIQLLSNQDNLYLDSLERELCSELLGRYDDVPWHRFIAAWGETGEKV